MSTEKQTAMVKLSFVLVCGQVDKPQVLSGGTSIAQGTSREERPVQEAGEPPSSGGRREARMEGIAKQAEDPT